MDVCYVLGKGSLYDNLEIRLSLRSIEQNGSNIGRVFVVGEKPDWIQSVVHIPFEEKYTKENNIFGKIITVSKTDISDSIDLSHIILADEDKFVAYVGIDDLLSLLMNQRFYYLMNILQH